MSYSCYYEGSKSGCDSCILLRNKYNDFRGELNMTYTDMLNYCLSKKGAYIDHPFGPEIDIIKVEGKIFAQLFVLNGKETATLNCERMTGEFYRHLYPGVIVRGYHCPAVQKPYFNSFPIDVISHELILEMIEHSYATVVAKLPKYKQRLLSEDSNM